jgi:hypothetical protein
MAQAPSTSQHLRMPSVLLIIVPLCECDDARARQSLSAELDEPTLTNCVLDRDGRLRCRRLPSLRKARSWAHAYRHEPQRALAPGPSRTT